MLMMSVFPEQIPAVVLPQVPGSQGNVAVAVYAAPRQQQCREEESSRCLMTHDHFDFSVRLGWGRGNERDKRKEEKEFCSRKYYIG